MDKKTVSLVLGSGGARGLAHIGVIRCLNELGYEIKYISGTSIGALIGGIYAAGKLDEYEHWVKELDRTDVVRLLDISFSRGALFKGEKIIGVLRKLVGDRNIEDLPVGYTAVATDLNTEKEIWLNQGPLFDAIKASVAVPMVFEPVKIGKRLLVDGGLVNPIPIAPTLNDDSDITIVVDLNAPAEGIDLEPVQLSEAKENHSEYRTKLVKFIEDMFSSDDQTQDDIPGFYDLLMRSMDAMQTTIANFRMAAYKPDVIIRIPRDASDFFEFYKANKLIEFGYQRTKDTLKKMDQ
jgi:NTE family protein